MPPLLGAPVSFRRVLVTFLVAPAATKIPNKSSQRKEGERDGGKEEGKRGGREKERRRRERGTEEEGRRKREGPLRLGCHGIRSLRQLLILHPLSRGRKR